MRPSGNVVEVLLQRREAEGVVDREFSGLAVLALGLDEEPAVPPEEAGLGPEMLSRRVVEIAEHCLVGRRLHRPGVLGFGPGCRLGRVAAGAGGRPA